MSHGPLRRLISRFRREEDGVALVEFAVTFPIMLLIFGVIVEGSRTFWSYQSAISGVRDATRYAGRAAPRNVCATTGTISDLDGALLDIVASSIFAGAVRVDSVTSTVECVDGNWRGGRAPIASVTATLIIDYPLNGLFRLVGGDLGQLTTSVTDSTRIYGT